MPSPSPATRDFVIARDGYACRYCGAILVFEHTKFLTMDHVMPKSRGGSNCPENLAVSCPLCNSRRGNRTLEESGYTLFPSRFFDFSVENAVMFEAERTAWPHAKLAAVLAKIRIPAIMPPHPNVGYNTPEHLVCYPFEGLEVATA